MEQSKLPEFTAIIVDDEPLARQLLEEMLMEHPLIKIIGECTNGFEAVKAIATKKPDIVFLDISMPRLDGFEVLELLEKQPTVVFVTAHDEYALQAFDAHAIDYLLKPFSEERLASCIGKIMQGQKAFIPTAQSVVHKVHFETKGYLERIAVKDGENIHIIPAHAIDYVSAESDYINTYVGDKSFLKLQTLSSLEKSLDPSLFLRIHRSTLLQIDRIVRIVPYEKDKHRAILKDNTKLSISRRAYQHLKKSLNR